MYERNAIILERYFEKAFGYDNKNSIKTNFKDYKELVEDLENYKNVSDEEDAIIQEYDAIAGRIREIQDKQVILNNKNNKYQEERTNIFQNIDENSNNMMEKINSINGDIQSINEQIEENAKLYVEAVNEFNEKSDIRTKIGKKRRVIEEKYNNKLEETLDNYRNISLSQVKQAKQFGNLNIAEIKKQLKDKIRKNGEKEKVPFNEDVVSKAINLCIDIQKKETEVLVTVYERTNRLFSEIKNGNTKIAKHKKLIKDSQSKLEFINAMKEYLIQFLDNERITAVNGEQEHNKLMKEACKNIEDDIAQIDNLYTLLLKETSRKIMKKNYNDLYKLEYLKDLENKSEDFEEEIKKLNLPVTIINPNYWRIEGMKKIYNTFYKCVTEYYGRDLTKYTSKFEKAKEEEIKVDKNDLELSEEKTSKKTSKDVKEDDDDEKMDRKKELIDRNTKKNSIDKKIELILEMSKRKNEEDWEDSWEDEEDDDENETEEENNKRKSKEKNKKDNKKKETTKTIKSRNNKKKKIEETEDEEIEDEEVEDEETEEEDDYFDDFDEEKMDEIKYVDEDETFEEDEDGMFDEEDDDDIFEEDDEEDDEDEQVFDEEDEDEISEEDDDEEDEDEQGFEEDDNEIFEEEEDDDDDIFDEDEDEEDDDIFDKKEKSKNTTKKDKDKNKKHPIQKDTATNEAKEDWGNEFINIKEKEKKKKRGWFFR